MLESHIPPVPDEDALIEVKIKYHRHINDNNQLAACIMLVSLSFEL
jgi:hypothetical protein